MRVMLGLFLLTACLVSHESAAQRRLRVIPLSSDSVITASSCSRDHVAAMLALLDAGDTGQIPAGTCQWTSGIDWVAPANVTVKGSGNLSTLGGGDTTVLVDNYAADDPLLNITASATGTLRLAGFTIEGGTGSLKENLGLIAITGPATVRLDHLHLDTTTYSTPTQSKIVVFGDRVTGVWDHSIIDAYLNSAFYAFNGRGTDLMGNTTWASATDFGGSNFIFIEDNLFRATTDGPIRLGDGWSAARVVWRFNTIIGGAGFEHHATGHAGDDRGVRATEGYGNSFEVLADQSPGTGPPFDMADASSGTALIWGNVAEANALKNGFVFNVTRKNNDTYTQDPTPDDWGYCGTAFNGTGSGWDGNTTASTGYPCLDQPGRGISDLLTGFFPNKLNGKSIAWPNQALEPIYIWNNTITPAAGWGGSVYRDLSSGRVVANRDYYPQASGVQTSSSSPFDGTVGTGWGTLARRPATCTAGVGYFATDQGSWNTSSSNPEGVDFAGADGLLYKCTSTDIWTLYVTPYTYPHPLNTP